MHSTDPLKVSAAHESIDAYNCHTHTHYQGVLARMFDALRRSQNSPPHKSNLFSLAGSKKILSGSTDVLPSIVSPNSGISRFTKSEYKELKVGSTFEDAIVHTLFYSAARRCDALL